MSVLSDFQNNLRAATIGSKTAPLVGPTSVLIPAGTFTPEYPITLTTGTNAMTGINLPYPDFQGSITFIAVAGGFTWTTAGNIAVAGSATLNAPVTFMYIPNTGKWYAK